MRNRTILIVLFILVAAYVAFPQTTEFTYQGNLKDGAAPANANYDFEFALFDAAAGGTQIASTIARNTVLVTGGIFAVKLDFGSQFPGANRYLEIRVRISGGSGLTTLSPRQLVNSAPYSVKSLNADNATNATNAANAVNAVNADNATNATNATTANGLSGACVGCVQNSHINTVDGGKVTGPVANATNAATAVNFSGPLTGDVAGTQNATQLANNAVTTTKIADSAVTAAKIAGGQVVKGVTVGATTLTDNVTLAGSANITITPTTGNTLTIASTAGGVGGSGTLNSIPVGPVPQRLAIQQLSRSRSMAFNCQTASNWERERTATMLHSAPPTLKQE